MIEAPVSIPQISIEEANPGDLPQVVGLIEKSGLVKDKPPGYIRGLVDEGSRSILVARDQGEVAGTVVIQEAYWPYFGINYIVVDKDKRGMRIGERLMASAEDFVRGRGGTRISLVVVSENPGLNDFYARYGYTSDHVLMRKDL